MTVDDSWLHSLSFVHISPEEDHQVLCALMTYPRRTLLLFFLVTYSCNNFLILSPVSLKALWATLKHSYDRIQRFSNTI